MKIVKYEIHVFEGILDMAHGGGRTITEFYVPDLRLVINSEFVFLLPEDQKPRYEKDETDNPWSDESHVHILEEREIEDGGSEARRLQLMVNHLAEKGKLEEDVRVIVGCQ